MSALPAGAESLLAGSHGDPFAVLGPHRTGPGRWQVRVLLRQAVAVQVLPAGGAAVAARQAHPLGLFVADMAGEPGPYRLRVQGADGAARELDDPYAFGLLLSGFDLDLLRAGRHRHLGEVLGAHPLELGGMAGVRFAVWAPNARRVSVIGDWNGFDGRFHPMRRRDPHGIWELFIPGLGPGERYKFELLAPDGSLRTKADPVAWQAERPPATASIVRRPTRHAWTDGAWMAARAQGDPLARPLAIYEVHPGSWGLDRPEGDPLPWRTLAARLAAYVAELGFTHVELMPPAMHPFGGSWGYQVTGHFASDPRHGDPDGLRAFVDHLHAQGIGVIIDFVPAHFPKDDFALARFDGTPLYEYADPREGEHRGWGTCVFNVRRPEVANLLLAAALHWCREFHIDGLRVDAVSSMLYRDYDRRPGEWVANDAGGNANEEAVAFLRELTGTVRAEHPGVLLIAEESTAWQGVTAPPELGGLGFHLKWNMGWMHDTLGYLALDPILRSGSHDRITFHQWYAYDERWVLPLSHDEVVHGKRSLIDKPHGDWWQRRAQLRLLLGWQIAVPGRKLLFQGGEFGQGREFDWRRPPDWTEAAEAERAGITAFLKAALRLYRGEPALHQRDDHRDGFAWVDCDNRPESVVAFLRRAQGPRPILIVCNFTPVPRRRYPLSVPVQGPWRELLSSDDAAFGGSGSTNPGDLVAGSEAGGRTLRVTLPPLGIAFFAPVGRG